jgi:undecaprenyl-diphosphatase
MSHWDETITRWINGLAVSYPFLHGPMTVVTQLGIPVLVLLVAIRWWIGGRGRAERHVTVACGLSFIVGLGLNQLILLFVHRARPYDVGVTHCFVPPSSDPSFPSDHSTAAFAIAFAFLLHRRYPLGLCFSAAALLVAFSRVFLGVHYFGDVVGGGVTAFAAASLVRLCYREGTAIDKWVTGIL